MQEYPWYELVEESEELQQGDYIEKCEVLVPTYSSSSQEYKAKAVTTTYNVVIVSQSCDLENGNLDYVLVCPRESYSEFVRSHSNASLNRIYGDLEDIRRGRMYRYCMLHECTIDGFPQGIQIVDLGMVFSVPYDTMKEMAKSHGKRLRLLSPYKEKLAQAFAYYYMRVALPMDIPKFEKGKALVQSSVVLEY